MPNLSVGVSGRPGSVDLLGMSEKWQISMEECILLLLRTSNKTMIFSVFKEVDDVSRVTKVGNYNHNFHSDRFNAEISRVLDLRIPPIRNHPGIGGGGYS